MRVEVDGDEQCGATGDADPACLDTRTWLGDLRHARVSSATNGVEPSRDARPWGDLVLAQLRGIAAWLDEATDARQRLSREARLDRDRAPQARDRERAALLAYPDQQEPAVITGQPPSRRPMIVVAHRQPWWRDKVRDALDRAGLCVHVVLEEGADVVAVLVAEQPEVVLALGHRAARVDEGARQFLASVDD